MLILQAEIWQRSVADMRLANGLIVEIGNLDPADGETVVDACGAALLPGLHDHHIHMAAEAARRASINCGPPDTVDEAGLALALAQPGEGWLRGTNYHESVAGMLTRAQLDGMQPDRPVRIQDRTGRMWFLNTRGMEELLARAPPPEGLDRDTGRLFDEDAWLRRVLGNAPPDLGPLSRELAHHGITGVTDMSPTNYPAMAAHFASEQHAGRLLQRIVAAGSLELAGASFSKWLQLGPGKLHLHDAALPDPEDAAGFIRAVHAQGRAIAIHCVTEAELVVALAAIENAGIEAGDRIEHAGIAPHHLVQRMAEMGLQVCSNPAFVAARGDRYLDEVDADDIPHLYRLASLRHAGIVLAAGSDAPYGPTDPWAAMRAATDRRTAGGKVIGASEALSAEEALRLYLADPLNLAQQRDIAVGNAADLVLLDHPWSAARERLLAEDVRLVIAGGSTIHQRVDKSPL